MTVQTKAIYQDYDSDGNPLLGISFDWDDAAVPLQVTMVHVLNNDTRVRHVQVTSTFNGKVYAFDIQPGAQIDQAVPPNIQNRLQVAVLPNGRIDGLDMLIT